MASEKFNASERRRYRLAGALLAVGAVMVLGAFAWLTVDALSGGDGIPGGWLTIPGTLLVLGGAWWSSSVVRSASKRWTADPS